MGNNRVLAGIRAAEACACCHMLYPGALYTPACIHPGAWWAGMPGLLFTPLLSTCSHTAMGSLLAVQPSQVENRPLRPSQVVSHMRVLGPLTGLAWYCTAGCLKRCVGVACTWCVCWCRTCGQVAYLSSKLHVMVHPWLVVDSGPSC